MAKTKKHLPGLLVIATFFVGITLMLGYAIQQKAPSASAAGVPIDWQECSPESASEFDADALEKQLWSTEDFVVGKWYRTDFLGKNEDESASFFKYDIPGGDGYDDLPPSYCIDYGSTHAQVIRTDSFYSNFGSPENTLAENTAIVNILSGDAIGCVFQDCNGSDESICDSGFDFYLCNYQTEPIDDVALVECPTDFVTNDSPFVFEANGGSGLYEWEIINNSLGSVVKNTEPLSNFSFDQFEKSGSYKIKVSDYYNSANSNLYDQCSFKVSVPVELGQCPVLEDSLTKGDSFEFTAQNSFYYDWKIKHNDSGMFLGGSQADDSGSFVYNFPKTGNYTLEVAAENNADNVDSCTFDIVDSVEFLNCPLEPLLPNKVHEFNVQGGSGDYEGTLSLHDQSSSVTFDDGVATILFDQVGDYTLSAQDALNAPNKDSCEFTIVKPPPVSINCPDADQVSEVGDQHSFEAEGGTGDYKWTITSPDDSVEVLDGNLPPYTYFPYAYIPYPFKFSEPGQYTFLLQDYNFLSNDSVCTVTINEPPPAPEPEPEPEYPPVVMQGCPLLSDTVIVGDSLEFGASGGFGEEFGHYNWGLTAPDQAISFMTGTNEVVSFDQEGFYHLWLNDWKGDHLNPVEVCMIEVKPALQIDSCQPNGTVGLPLLAKASGGSGQYEWTLLNSNGNAVSQSILGPNSPFSPSPETSGAHTIEARDVTSTDANEANRIASCEADVFDQVSIDECPGALLSGDSFTFDGNFGSGQYVWKVFDSDENQVGSSVGSDFNFTFMNPGQYKVVSHDLSHPDNTSDLTGSSCFVDVYECRDDLGLYDKNGVSLKSKEKEGAVSVYGDSVYRLHAENAFGGKTSLNVDNSEGVDYTLQEGDGYFDLSLKYSADTAGSKLNVTVVDEGLAELGLSCESSPTSFFLEGVGVEKNSAEKLRLGY